MAMVLVPLLVVVLMCCGGLVRAAELKSSGSCSAKEEAAQCQ